MKAKFYFSDSCHLCHIVKPELEKMNSKIPIEFHNITDNIPEDVILMSLPSLVLFDRENNEIDRLSGKITPDLVNNIFSTHMED